MKETEIIVKCISGIWDFISTVAQLAYSLIIFLGAIFSGAILYKLFPSTFFSIMEIVYPIVTVIFKIVYIGIIVSLLLFLAYLILQMFNALSEYNKKSKERYNKRKEELISEIVNRIKTKRNKK